MKRIFQLFFLLLFVIYSPTLAQEKKSEPSMKNALTIPSKISYQGVLTDNSNKPLDGVYSMQFGLYSVQSGGTELWSESQNVSVVNGVFNVLLGSSNPIPSSVAFNVPYWLQVTVSGSALPRIELTSSPYSFNTTRIQGQPVSTGSPLLDQVLKWTGTEWAPGTDNSGGKPSGNAGGDLSDNYPDPSVVKIQGEPISSSAPSSGQVLKWTGSEWAPGTDDSGGKPSGSAGGDLSNNYPNPTVVRIQGNSISSSTPSSDQVLKWTGSEWAPGTDNTGGNPSGGAGGDLSDNYPNPLVVRIQGKPISSSAPNSGQVLKWAGNEWTPGADNTLTLPFSGSISTIDNVFLVENTNTNNSSAVITGISNSSTGRAIDGYAAASSGSNYGVYGETASSDGIGVYGLASLSSGNNIGVCGQSLSQYGTGVLGIANILNGVSQVGIWGQSSNDGYAGYFSGNVHINGTLEKSGGSFEIDDPLDPENMILRHSFVESPDMMNIYNGNVTTDASGIAVIQLPHYFDALNKDFRYQLTVIGQFAQAIVAEEIQNNHFTIQTDKPNVKVSWQVTGIRKDPWAEKNRIVVEEQKSPRTKGYYLNPEAYGLSKTRSVEYALHPEIMKKLNEEFSHIKSNGEK